MCRKENLIYFFIIAGVCEAYNVFVSGNYAYMADGSNGLEIINISTLSNPVLEENIGKYYGGKTVDVYVSGSHAYLADWEISIFIVDITNPADPVSVGSYSFAAQGLRELFVLYPYVYEIDAYPEESDFRITDISNPLNPTLINNSIIYGDAVDIFVLGNYAYITRYHVML